MAAETRRSKSTKTEPKRNGRPPFEMTPEVLNQIEVMGACGLTQGQMALVLGIHPNTLTRKKVDEEVSVTIKKGKAMGLRESRASLLKRVKTGDVPAIKYYERVVHGVKEDALDALTPLPVLRFLRDPNL